MIDVNKLAVLVASVPMHDAEREAMLKLIPKMPVRHLRTLFHLLEGEWAAIKRKVART